MVPVQSSSEFQVSGVALGSGVASPHISPPISHLPLQIIFEVTTQWWPMEGTVALDDIVYSAREGCHSSLEVPVEGAGPVLVKPSTAWGAGAGASSSGRWVKPGIISSPCREILWPLCGRDSAQSSPGPHRPGAGGCRRLLLAEAARAGEQDSGREQDSPGLRQHHFSRRKDRDEGLSCLPPTAPEQHFPKSSADPSRLPLSPRSANTSREVQRALPLIWLLVKEQPCAAGLT